MHCREAHTDFHQELVQSYKCVSKKVSVAYVHYSSSSCCCFSRVLAKFEFVAAVVLLKYLMSSTFFPLNTTATVQFRSD